MKWAEKTGLVRGRDSTLVNGREVLIVDISAEGHGTLERPNRPHLRVISPPPTDDIKGSNIELPPFPTKRANSIALGLPLVSQLPSLPLIDDTDIGGPPAMKSPQPAEEAAYNLLTADIKPAVVDKDCMRDPLNDSFFDDTWNSVAENNTKIFRRVFRCNPDNEVTNWHEYTEFQAYSERFAQAQAGTKAEARQEQEGKGKTVPPGAKTAVPNLGVPGDGLTPVVEKVNGGSGNGSHPLGNAKEWADVADARNKARPDTLGHEAKGKSAELNEKSPPQSLDGQSLRPKAGTPMTPLSSTSFDNIGAKVASPGARATLSPPPVPAEKTGNTTAGATGALNQGSVKTRRRRGTGKSRKGFAASDDLVSREDAESLLNLVQGNLVVFPTEWLKAEEHNSNWLYQVDQVAPLQI
jgi:phospholipase D1/2